VTERSLTEVPFDARQPAAAEIAVVGRAIAEEGQQMAGGEDQSDDLSRRLIGRYVSERRSRLRMMVFDRKIRK
jgi:hypothetical protein